MDTDPAHLRKIEQTAAAVEGQLASHSPGVVVAPEEAGDELSAYLKTTGKVNGRTFAALATMNRTIVGTLAAKTSLAQLPAEERKLLRTNIYLEGEAIGKLNKQHLLTDSSEKTALMAYKGMLDKVTKFLPTWVKVAVALALGLGTMIGWKRIVTTVGEKIGKEHLTYAQGASAEIIAMGTIGLADYFGLPVSTTHVLSSGVAGTMAANHSGLQVATLRNLLLAWVLTLPVCVLLGAATFAGGLFVVLNNLVFYLVGFMAIAIAIACVVIVRRLTARKANGAGVALAASASE